MKEENRRNGADLLGKDRYRVSDVFQIKKNKQTNIDLKCWKDQFTSQLSPSSAQCFANGFPDVNIKEIRNDYKPLYAS